MSYSTATEAQAQRWSAHQLSESTQQYLPRATTRGSPLAEALGNGVEEGVVTMMEIY